MIRWSKLLVCCYSDSIAIGTAESLMGHTSVSRVRQRHGAGRVCLVGDFFLETQGSSPKL